MIIKSVKDKEFSQYGRVIENLDSKELLEKLRETTPAPEDAVVYVPADAGLESLPVMDVLRDNIYGGMPIQIGYCNGCNTKLNCLEYHKERDRYSGGRYRSARGQTAGRGRRGIRFGESRGVFMPKGYGGGTVRDHASLRAVQREERRDL